METPVISPDAGAPLPGALLFDLDDTLVSYDQAGQAAWPSTCAVFAPELGVEAEALHDAIKSYARWYWDDPVRHRAGRLVLEETRRLIVGEALRRLGREDPALARRLADHFSALQESLIAIFPDTESTLDFFKSRGTRLALITNGNAALQRRKIERFRLDRFFSHFFVEGELGFGKPDSRIFTAALTACGTAPAETWCVGDNLEWDVRGAQALGIFAVWKDTYRRGLGESPVKPDRVIFELNELINAPA